MTRPHVHFVTGRLAEHALRRLLGELAPRAGFDYSISVLGISVAALMTPQWIARRLRVPAEATRVVVPGFCGGDLGPVQALAAGRPVERGPKDLRELPAWFGREPLPADYGAYDIEILAEINHAPRLAPEQISSEARRLAADGADVIDLGCDPGEPWQGAGDAVRRLRDAGLRVSIDSYHPREIADAVHAGAELVLSVNSSNVAAAADWGCEVVAVPDEPSTLDGLEGTLARLEAAGVPFRIDPILAPIGFGFAASLDRYFEARRRWPAAEMMMGIGNLTELTDVDSAGLNVLLLAVCQELAVRSVLTTQVIGWARTAVRECDLARRLVRYAAANRVLPKHVEPRLVMLRDPTVLEHGDEGLARLAAEVKDRNYRLFAERSQLHVLNADLHLTGDDPFELFERLLAAEPKNIDASHAFYLGYEFSKAVTALTLGKDYRQDQALQWGFLTREETSHRSRRATGRKAAAGSPDAEPSPRSAPAADQGQGT